MNRMSVKPVALCLFLSVAANGAVASAQSGLSEEPEINRGLLVLAVADKIRRECDAIGGRLFRARSYANALEKNALARGYSSEEIDTYINDKHEKAKVRERRNAYFQSKGASNLDPQSLCVLGRDEIAQGSQVGYLLRAK